MSELPLRFGGSLRAVILFSVIAAGVLLAREVSRREVLGDPGRIPAGSREACLSCHSLEEGPGGAHAAPGTGCESCHLGDALAFEETRAHRGLEKEPGALDTVGLTCGRAGCHPAIADRVKVSLMATGPGLVSVDRFVFGEQATPDGTTTLDEVLASEDPSPADDHLRHLCGGCHLGARRDNRDDAVGTGADVGSGCGSCHSRRPPALPPGPSPEVRRPHSTLLEVPDDDQCFGCHSRSGRISLSYRGLSEVLPGQEPPCETTESLSDERVLCRTEADVHQLRGLACVDCHLAAELMGDGQRYQHQEEAVQVRCVDCHRTADTLPATLAVTAITDPVTRRLLDRREPPLPPETRIPITRVGTPLWNLRETDTGLALVGKLDGKLHPSRPTPRDRDHGLPGHERLTCSSCHAVWAPTCPTCHTKKEVGPGARQWDFAAGKETPGAWVERSEGAFAHPPTLGLRHGPDGSTRILPTVPGMILELETDEAHRSLRLFAPLDPHTTGKSRSCASCHLDPRALGLGSGKLKLTAEGPRLETADGKAAPDRWTSLGESEPGAGTRTGLGSLDAGALERSLRVGVCLGCHPEKAPIYDDFRVSLGRLRSTPACRGPRWPWLFDETP